MTAERTGLQRDEPVARLVGVAKTYHIYTRAGDRLKQQFARGRKRYYAEVCALQATSLEVRAGEIFAIVGQNGSGKSTLLKLIARTLRPDCGSVVTRGRVAALLELGAGFNPELTGRENARINAALLGLDAAATAACLPDIERFAEVGEFFDRPVKTYSSGMFARVAFATMVATRPDLLIVDEILSVGDEPFQRKCFARILEMAHAGTAVAFVTHNTPLVAQIAHRAMLLERGRCTLMGAPRDVAHAYYRSLSLASDPAGDPAGDPASPARGAVQGFDRAAFDPALSSRSVTEYARSGAVISDVVLVDDNGRRVNQLRRGQTCEFRYRVTLTADAGQLECGSLVKNVAGVELGGLLVTMSEGAGPARAGETWLARIRFCCRLLPGVYFFNAGVRGGNDGDLRYLHRILDALTFRVIAEHDSLAITGMVDFSAATAGSVERIVSAEPPV